MTYSVIEASVEGGQPIELYKFVLGTEEFLRTSSENDVVVPTLAETYTAIPVERRSLVNEVLNPSSGRLEVSLPAADDFVQRFINVAPGTKPTLTIFRMHRADLGGSDDKVTFFKGTVRSVSFKDSGRTALLQALPLTAGYARPLPRQTFQGLCNHYLYDARCTLDRDSVLFKHSGTVTSVSGAVITVTGAGAFSVLSDFFEAGYAEFDNGTQTDQRLIVSQSGNDLTLITPFHDDVTGQIVVVRAGCKHRLVTDCKDKFSNELNFGGFPYVPKQNPFEGID